MAALTDVVLPIFGVVLLGYFAGWRGLLGAQGVVALNGFVFYFSFPVMLFGALAKSPVSVLLNGPFAGAYLGGVFLTFALAWAFGHYLLRRSRLEAVAQAANASCGNTGYVGIPLLAAAYGEAGVLPGSVAAILTAAVTIMGLVVAFELAVGKGAGFRAWRRVAKALALNPLMLASIAGIAWSLAGWAMPVPLAAFVGLLGTAAPPGALFAIGLFLGTQPFRLSLDEIGWQVACKLCLQPAITLALALLLFPMDPLWTAAAVISAALPGAATPFLLAQQYGAYVQPTSTAILVSTVFSVATLAALLTVFR